MIRRIARRLSNLTQGHVPWVTLAISLLAGAILLAGETPRNALIYDRAAIGAGEIWRIWTGHLVHADALHLFWNLSAFAFLAGHYELTQEGGRRRLTILLATSATLIGAGLYAFFPGWNEYSGLSGICYAPLATLLVVLAVRTRSLVFPILLAGVIVKVIVELALGRGVFEFFGNLPTVAEVHAIGLAVGGLAALAWHRFMSGSRSALA